MANQQKQDGVDVQTLELEYKALVAAKPRRPLSAYNLFFALERQKIIHGPPGEDKTNKNSRNKGNVRGSSSCRSKKNRVGFENLTREVASRWKVVDPVEKKRLQEVAQSNRVIYFQQIGAWKKRKKSIEDRLLAAGIPTSSDDPRGSSPAEEEEEGAHDSMMMLDETKPSSSSSPAALQFASAGTQEQKLSSREKKENGNFLDSVPRQMGSFYPLQDADSVDINQDLGFGVGADGRQNTKEPSGGPVVNNDHRYGEASLTASRNDNNMTAGTPKLPPPPPQADPSITTNVAILSRPEMVSRATSSSSSIAPTAYHTPPYLVPSPPEGIPLRHPLCKKSPPSSLVKMPPPSSSSQSSISRQANQAMPDPFVVSGNQATQIVGPNDATKPTNVAAPQPHPKDHGTARPPAPPAPPAPKKSALLDQLSRNMNQNEGCLSLFLDLFLHKNNDKNNKN